jgi:hypothetical protein
MTWTAQDEINFCKWVDDKGFQIGYKPHTHTWVYFHREKTDKILGEFAQLKDLKKHLAVMKGEDKSTSFILEQSEFEKMAQARRILNMH